jgi:hypothetical protein
MSSVTFLASAALTVCVLHAVDQNMADAVNKVTLNESEKVEVNQVDKFNFEKVIKPAEAKALTPSAQLFNANKTESLVTKPNEEKRIFAKNTNAI